MNDRQSKTRRTLWKASLSQTWSRIHTWFSKDPGEESQAQIEEQKAQTLVQAGKQLKAGVAKAIQLLGYFQGDDIIHSSLAQSTLAELYNQIPGESAQEIEQVFIEDFGKKPEELFAIFEKQAFAAASLGEVHYAKTFDSPEKEWAVKVQYPFVAQALQKDLEEEALLEQLMGASLGETLSASARFRIKQIILEELDYLKESQFLTNFSQAFMEESAFVFPKIEARFCSKRVLTATYLKGAPILLFLKTATKEAKNHIGKNLFLYMFSSPLVQGLVNADPNPGNFLILDQGEKIGLIDFGCCFTLTEAQAKFEQVFWQSLLAQDAEVFRYTLHRMGFVQNALEFDSSSYRLWEQLIARPFLSNSFLFTPAYAQEVIATTQTLMQGRRFTLSPDFLLLWRQRLGLISLLGQTQAQGNFRKILFDILKTVEMAPKGISI